MASAVAAKRKAALRPPVLVVLFFNERKGDNLAIWKLSIPAIRNLTALRWVYFPPTPINKRLKPKSSNYRRKFLF
ncbi:hypothetical protein ASB65_02510 [Agrobacterium tumefaciens str. B6]|nr:hypothetical protein ASB65_02510 [Agrobacterium tumefaciens str. B6]MQB23945.1 hypothetical protein [Agrobacterium tumefaciens]OCJ41059.1 hypothetical protein A6U90_02490 [Agrobacterium tumefaciens]OVE91469.1 hypothetical protein B7W89_03065 [Agrobacterium tumefaciens]QAA96751.1 hypothetical protein DC439_02575 [Agrobacterium tumefaciens]